MQVDNLKVHSLSCAPCLVATTYLESVKKVCLKTNYIIFMQAVDILVSTKLRATFAVTIWCCYRGAPFLVS